MSADLWAAFGSGEDATSNPWAQPSPTDNKISSKQILSPGVESQSEALVDVSKSRQDSQQTISTLQSPWGTEALFSPIHRVAVTAAVHANPSWKDSEEDTSWTEFEKPHEYAHPWAASRSSGPMEVLWDADQVEEEDEDFGEFEGTNGDVSKEIMNLEIGDKAPKPPTIQIQDNKQSWAPVSTSESVSALGRTASRKDEPTALLPSNKQKEMKSSPDSRQQKSLIDGPLSTEEDWDEWSPDPIKSPEFARQKSMKPISATSAASISKLSANNTKPPGTTENSAPPSPSRSSSQPRLPPISALAPTNIPPPSILISLLSTLIATLPAQVEKAMIAFTTNLESNTAADKALSTAVRKCLAALRVAARIVAGRKVRWKRDTHLSQSMKIGPAATAGKGGMKLSGIDRNELKREDREVAEFVRVWQSKLGSVKRALASVNSRIGTDHSGGEGRKLELPVIAEMMLIRTLKDEDGGMRSNKGCALCGVKREERIDKVDGVDVLDISSEWWIDHWGHRECRAFWYQHEKYLQQR